MSYYTKVATLVLVNARVYFNTQLMKQNYIYRTFIVLYSTISLYYNILSLQHAIKSPKSSSSSSLPSSSLVSWTNLLTFSFSNSSNSFEVFS